MNKDGALRAPTPPTRDAPETLGAYLKIDLPRLLFWLRRGASWIVAGTLVGLMLSVAYAKLTPPRYTVTTDILVNPAGLQITSDDLFRQNDQQRDAQLLNVESKRQTLLSRSVLLRAISTLDLQNDPEFVPPPSLFSIGSFLGGTGSSQSSEIVALDSLEKRLTARRTETSFVVTMSVWSLDAQKSIRISEAIIKAFKEELVDSDAESARKSAESLTLRIGRLKDDVNEADEAVEAFRRENRLESSGGELISTRSMSQVNEQLGEARQRLIAARSRYRELSTENVADAAAMVSATMPTLRAQYATLKSQIASESNIYGSNHPRVVQQNSALSALQNEIDAETKRVLLAARNELNQATAVVSALEAQAATKSVEVFTDNDAQIRLRELVREAAAKAAIYEAFLQRANEITERQQIDTTNIRIISSPVLPKSRSWPPSTTQLAGFGSMVGMVLSVLAVLGFGIAADMGQSSNRAHQPSTEIPTPYRQARTNSAPQRPRAPIAAPMPRNGRNRSLLNLATDLQRADTISNRRPIS